MPLPLVFGIPGQCLTTGSGDQVAIGIIAVARLLDGVEREAVVDGLAGAFVATHASDGIVAIILAIGRRNTVLVVVGEGIVGRVVVVVFEVAKAVVMHGQIQPILAALSCPGVDVVEPPIAVAGIARAGRRPRMITARLPQVATRWELQLHQPSGFIIPNRIRQATSGGGPDDLCSIYQNPAVLPISLAGSCR